MRKGITLQMIGGVVLALVGVGVLLALANNMMGGGLFCSVYGSVAVIIPGEGPGPAGCNGDTGTEPRVVDVRDKDEFTAMLAGAATDCWQRYRGFLTERELCAGWNVKSLESPVSEADVTAELLENGLCTELGNTDIDAACGSGDHLYMDGQVEAGDYIVIQYANASGTERVEVR